MNDHDINDYDSKTLTVQGLDKNRQPVTHELQYLTSQMRQSVIQGLIDNLKALAALRGNNCKTGRLRYKSDYLSINLKQHKITYRFYDECHIGIQGFKERIRIKGANQFWNIPELEFANAKLLNLPDGYYLAITTSDGRKIKVFVEESERLKKCQRLIARRKKGSSNRYKAVKLMRKEYQKLGSKKRDTANKIVHELLKHEIVYMQDENLKGCPKYFFGQCSIQC